MLLRAWHGLVIARQREMAELMTLENGKPIKESLGEINYSADYLELYSEEAKRIHVFTKFINKIFPSVYRLLQLLVSNLFVEWSRGKFCKVLSNPSKCFS